MNATACNTNFLAGGWHWEHHFAALGSNFYSAVAAQPLPAPYRVAHSDSAARLLGLDSGAFESPHWAAILSGSHFPDAAMPLASVYSGHQFGVWAGQLGDGRATLLGALTPPADQASTAQEIQLKGAGLTPYSRMGDGRAVLRSSIREFLCSEAMHALGIATTRALSVYGSDQPVYREQVETAAVVTRLAPSFIRFGHFEHFCHHGLHRQLRELADYVIDRFYPQCRSSEAFDADPYAALLHAVGARTATMIAQWQSVGFCHGVMNTDNMSILGLTIDYGPFQFLDGFDPRHVCNHSDTQGRYAFGNQPNIAYWNLACLGQALLPLIGDAQSAERALRSYGEQFERELDRCMAAKLGLDAAVPGARALWQPLLGLLAAEKVDYTIFWRTLSHWVAAGADAAQPARVRDLFVQPAGIDRWLLQYSEHLSHISSRPVAQLMLKTNPKYVLRNHLGETVIGAAQQRDYAPLAQLLAVLEHPFDEHPGHEGLADFAPDWAAGIAISCSS